MTNLSKNDSLIQRIEEFEHPILTEKGGKAVFLTLDKAIEYCVNYSFISSDGDLENTIGSLFRLKDIFKA